MPGSPSFGRVEAIPVADLSAPLGKPDPETPFRILILGDFSGKSAGSTGKPEAAVAPLKAIRIDRDDFDEVLRRLKVSVSLSQPDAGGPPISLPVNELEDFHPDQVVRRVPLLTRLHDLRTRLLSPRTFDEAAKEVRAWEPTGMERAGPSREDVPSSPADRPPEVTSGELLSEILHHTQSQGPGAALSTAGEWRRFLRHLVGPHLVANPDPEQDELVARVDAVLAGMTRMVLHHRPFQALEAIWRALHVLVQGLETGTELQLSLVDLSREELAADLDPGRDVEAGALYRLVVEDSVGTPGAHPWALIVGGYSFDRTLSDVSLLRRVGLLARAAGAPFVAGAGPTFAGVGSFTELPDGEPPGEPDAAGSDEIARAWRDLRSAPEAGWLALAMPRFLLRLPYGQTTDPVSAFPFEELEDGQSHEAYLWGNPAFALAYLIGLGFTESGWSLEPGRRRKLEGLPLHVYEEDGERITKPCAEVLLTERGAEALIDRGLIPLLSVKNQDAIAVGRVQSIALREPALKGRWSEAD